MNRDPFASFGNFGGFNNDFGGFGGGVSISKNIKIDKLTIIYWHLTFNFKKINSSTLTCS